MNIPDGWLLVDLADVIVDMQPGFAQRPNDRDEGTRQLRTNNVSPEGEIDLTSVAYVKATDADLEKYGVRPGDVIFNNTNSVEWVGKTAYFDEEGEYVLSNHMTRIRADERILDAQFLAKYLHHLWRIGRSFRWAKHWVNQAAIDQSALARFRIVLPSLPEQRRIVSIMREANELRRLRRDAVRKAHDLLPSLFREMFGDPLANEKKWEIKPIKRMGVVTTGNTPSRDNPNNFGDFIEWVKSDNLDSPLDYVAPSKERLSEEGAKIGRIVPKGSTLITCIAGSPESIGKAALTDREVAFNQQINSVTPFDGVNPYFLYSLIKLSKPAIQSLSSGGMKGIVNKKQLEELSLICPPKELQDQFAPQVTETFNVKTDLVAAQQEVERLVRSLLALAFTGELTARWRAQHEAELIEAARERDALLSKSNIVEGTAKFTGTTTLTAEATVTRPAPPEREQMVATLSRKQQRVLDLANSMEGYFTLPQLSQASHEASELTHADIQQGLQLLAALGLVIHVRVATEPTKKELIFTPAYRRLLPSQDDSRLRDLDRLGANGR